MKERKNILILVPAWNGGIDRLFEQLNLGKQGSETDLHLVTFRTHGRSLYGISVLPFRFVYYSSAIFYSLFLLPFRLLKFFYLCVRGRVDLCHMNLSIKGSTCRKIIFGWLCRTFDVKYVIHLHGGRYKIFFDSLPVPFKRIVRSLFRHASRVIVLGRTWKEFVINDIGVDDTKVVILSNAVSGPEKPCRKNELEPPNILFLGRLIDAKGVADLLQALADRRLTEVAWASSFAGDGEVGSYRKRIKELGLSHRISVPGWLSLPDVTTLLERSSILVLPSYAENLPLSMLEGMAYSLCPVVTPVGAVTDVIRSGENGILVPVGDTEALAAALADLLKHPEKRRALADAARRDFEKNYDIRNYRAKLEAIYADALSEA